MSPKTRLTRTDRRVPHPVGRALAAALLAAAFVGPGCGGERGGHTGPAGEALPDQEVSDFAVSETDAGAVQWKLFARRASIYNDRSAVVAHGVRVDFFDEQGERSSTLTADEGELHQVRRDMVARGHVVLRTTEGTRMSTEELRFDNATQRIRSDRFVRVERGEDVLTGYGFESDPNLEHFEFKREVRATVRTRSGELLEPGGGR